jgi:hypothetical protein
MRVGWQTALSLVASDAEATPPSPFALHVGEVGGLRRQEEMIGIDASALIATMANDNAAADRTMLDGPSPAVSEESAAAIVHAAISAFRETALPDQAT